MLRKLGVILARTAWSWPCASWAESNARCSSWTDWLQSVELRSAVHARLNKGEARNALARAGILQPSRQGQGSELRATTLPGQRLQPGDGRHRSVEHRVPGACHPGAGRGRHTVWGGTCCNTSRHWGGSTLTCPTIPFGDKAASWKAASSVRYGDSENLSVRFFPNSAGSPFTPISLTPSSNPSELAEIVGAGFFQLWVDLKRGRGQNGGVTIQPTVYCAGGHPGDLARRLVDKNDVGQPNCCDSCVRYSLRCGSTKISLSLNSMVKNE